MSQIMLSIYRAVSLTQLEIPRNCVSQTRHQRSHGSTMGGLKPRRHSDNEQIQKYFSTSTAALAHGEKSHSITQSLSLFDAPGTEAVAC